MPHLEPLSPWPARRRFRHATVGRFVHLVSQLLRSVIGWGALVSGRRTTCEEQRVLRMAAQLFWAAQVLRREGYREEAFTVALAAFAALKRADPRETFVQLGGLVVGFVDDVAEEIGQTALAQPALLDLLDVLRTLESRGELPGIIAWLEERLRRHL